MWSKQLPAYMFYTTFYQESTYLTVPTNPPDVRCNESSTGAKKTADAVTCVGRENFFTINPEGMTNAIQYAFTITPVGGQTLEGSTSGSQSLLDASGDQLRITTIVKDHHGNAIKSFAPGSAVRMSIGDMLKWANVNLDDRAPAGAGGPGGDPLPPYNRMTGVLLDVNMELVNYGQADVDSHVSQVGVWNTHEMACIMTFKRLNDWTSLGVDPTHYKTPIDYYSATPKSKIVARTAEFVEAYRQGVKIVYSAHGKVGLFNPSYFLNVVVQALVLLGLSTQITRLAANYLTL